MTRIAADRRHILGRRDFLAGSAAAFALALAQGASAAPATEEGLEARARRRGLSFGCAVRTAQLETLPDFRAAVLREAGMLVAENELKWRPTEPEKGVMNVAPAEVVVKFAEEHALRMRGHTLAWHQNPPLWASETLAGSGGAALMLGHVEALARHFKGRVFEWDVVNEALMPSDGRDGYLRAWPLYDRGGYDFIADCFEAAHAADPSAKLYYNDFGLEYGSREDDQKRQGALKLLSELKKRKAPIHGLGLQSHLVLAYHFRESPFRRFLGEVAEMGLEIRLTEFDVNDRAVRGSPSYRDQMVSGAARQYLDVCFDEPAVKGLLTWGLAMPMSWLNEGTFRRKDGALQRCLPLDESYGRTLLWQAIATSIDNAPKRS